MVPQPTVSRIFYLLVPTIIVAVVNSYVPHDFALVRQVLSYVQFGFMALIMIVAVQYVLDDF
jgi:hypothetical protein